MDYLDELVIRWVEFREQWNVSHTSGNMRMEPTFTDFMDWLVSTERSNDGNRPQ